MENNVLKIKYPDIFAVKTKYQIFPSENFNVFSYIPLEPVLQKGPQCGLVALLMCLKTFGKDDISVDDIFEEAKSCKYTLNGEMFSTKNLAQLISHYLSTESVSIFRGNIDDDECIEHVKNNGLLLVPYDADGNHSPCLKNGHKAHWAVINGLLECSGILFVTAHHGKSKNLALWNLTLLSASNAQLEEFSPDRKLSDVPYIVPDGGLGGPNGLKNTCIFIKNISE